jgi:hypothetical protein
MDMLHFCNINLIGATIAKGSRKHPQKNRNDPGEPNVKPFAGAKRMRRRSCRQSWARM